MDEPFSNEAVHMPANLESERSCTDTYRHREQGCFDAGVPIFTITLLSICVLMIIIAT